MNNEVKIKNYHITFYFSDKINFETNIESELELNEFIIDFNRKIQIKEQRFVNFIGNGKKVMINMDNVLFYIID